MSEREEKSHGHQGSHGHDHPHGGHSHKADKHGGSHGHTHGAIDPSILTTEKGIWALKWSFIGLFIRHSSRRRRLVYRQRRASRRHNSQFQRCDDRYSVVDCVCDRSLETEQAIYLRPGASGRFSRSFHCVGDSD